MAEIITVTHSEFTGLNHLYEPESGKMVIRNGGDVIWSGRAREGDAFVVNYDDGRWTVVKRQYPQQKNHLLMWLMGYSKEQRFNYKGAALFALDKCRAEHALEPGYKEHQYAGVGWLFMLYTTDAHPEPQRIAAWVDPDVSGEMAKEIITCKDLTVATAELDDSIRPILKKVFGFKESDINELRNRLM